jgi:energy-coupling factor transporter ATP-binding protein EcfA2
VRDSSAVTRVVDASDGVVDPAVVARARRLLEEAERRAAAPPALPIVAVVGGTGSGKSSLVNALAGVPIARTGLVRPTTQEPLAWIPSDVDPVTAALLDDLGIGQRVSDPPAPDWVLVDLPDTDSVRQENALVAEWVIPRADVVVWVTDPVKYHDARTAEVLARLRPALGGVVVVLNKVDTLIGAEVDAVRVALGSFAAELGLEGRVVPAAGAPPHGQPIGVEAVRRAIDHAVGAASFDPVAHLRASAVDLIREATPTAAFAVRPWPMVEAETSVAVRRLLVPEGAGTALQALGRATGAAEAGGVAGGIAHRVAHGPVESARAGALDALERSLDEWRTDERTVAVRSALEMAMVDAAALTDAPPPGIGDRVDGAFADAVRAASSKLDVRGRPWWPFTRALGWIGPIALFAGVAMAVAGVPGGALVAAAGALVTGVVALLAPWSGRASATTAWERFAEDVAVGARSGLRSSVGDDYERSVGPALDLAAALAAWDSHPYT